MRRRVLVLLTLFGSYLFAESAAMRPEMIVANYCAAERDQVQGNAGTSMEVEIDASLPKLKKQGRLHALRHISALGRITYERLRFEGDGTIKNQVIARYLAAEIDSQKTQAPSLAVIPANYKFKYKGRAQADNRDVYIFHVTPRKKRTGLYKGELWIDATTFLRIQESGYLVKNPSIFLKKVAFVRKYVIRDGISVPLQVQSLVSTRLVGPAKLTIDFSNFAVDRPTRAGASQGNGQ